MAKPLGGNEENAIDSIAFVMHFNAPFFPHELSQLTRESLSTARYPGFNENIMHQINLPQQQANFAGFSMAPAIKYPVWQKFSPSGKVEHELRVEPQSIVYVCTQYTNWNEISYAVFADFESICDQFPDKKLEKLVLQVTDKFRLEEHESAIDALFINSSVYLTEKSKSGSKLWHVHQGWFDESHANCKVLNVLNIGSLELMGTDKVDVLVDHICEMRLFKHQDINNDILKESFQLAHDENVAILQGLLTVNMQKQIGLKDGQ